jgi:ActR/RegA family two-component response regulator
MSHSTANRLVLIVDDDANLANLIQRYMKKLGSSAS